MTRVHHCYDQVTSTFTYVASDAATGLGAITMRLLHASGEVRCWVDC